MRRTTLLIVGPLPPPVHGAGRVTQEVVDQVRPRLRDGSTRLETVSTSGRPASAGVPYHLSRILAHGHALRRLVLARCGGPTVLYVGGAGGAGLWYQLALVVASRGFGVPVVFHHHSSGYVATSHAVVRGIVRWMGKNGIHVCLSPSMNRDFTARYRPAGSVLTVSNARFVPGDPPRRRPEGAPVGLIHVSNLSVEKGTVRVVEAFRRLRAGGSDVSLVLVGEATDDAVREAVMTARRDHPEAFRHHGELAQEDVFRALDAADLFVFPTAYRYEAQPLVVLESLARGVPVLASARGSLGDLLPDRWLIDEDVPLEDQITRLLAEDLPRLREDARIAFECSRHSGDDLVTLLAG